MTTDPIPRALVQGDMQVVGLMPNSSNYTFLARCRCDDEEVLAVYKPQRGEIPLWDFPQGTLHRREVAAYEVAQALGWPNVPPTVLRGGPEGPGSAQLFVDHDPEQHFFTLERDRADDFRRVALFDLVANNADRKAGHCLLDAAGTIWVIDHGVCFSDEPKLRTVIWDFVGEPFSGELRADLERVRDELAGDLGATLGSLLAPEELTALGDRLDDLMRDGSYPEPVPGTRPFPWPPI